MTDIARWHEFAYEQTDIPAGLTVHDWRRQRARTRATTHRWSRILNELARMARGSRRTAASERCAV